MHHADEIQRRPAQTSMRSKKEQKTSLATSTWKDLFQVQPLQRKPVSQLAVETSSKIGLPLITPIDTLFDNHRRPWRGSRGRSSARTPDAEDIAAMPCFA